MAEPCGAEILVRNLKAQGVTRIFGVPGAKVDRVFDALLNSGIETVVCRHEQNASFIAAGDPFRHAGERAAACRRGAQAPCRRALAGDRHLPG